MMSMYLANVPKHSTCMNLKQVSREYFVPYSRLYLIEYLNILQDQFTTTY